MPSSRDYPIFLNLRKRHVLIVGGGSVAHRKTQGLLAADATVTLVAAEFAPQVSALRGVKRIRRPYQSADMKKQSWLLVFAATDSPQVNAQVQADAAQTRVLCCRCDQPECSEFSGAAVAHVGPVTLAIGTAQASPALAARIRDQAATAIDPVLAHLAELLPAWRAKAKKLLGDPVLRRNFLKQLSGPTMENTLRQLGPTQARRLFARWLNDARNAAKPKKTPSGKRTK